MIESSSPSVSSSSSSSPSSPVYWSFDEPRLDGMRRDALEDEHFWWGGIRETRRMETKTHYLAFTSSGKPVWTRFGDVLKLSTVVGALSAICAIAEDEDDDETVKSTEEDVSEREDIDDEKDGKKRIKDRFASVKKNRTGQLHYVEKRTKKCNIRLAVLRKGALRFAAVSRDALETEHTLRVKLDLISKAFVFLFGNAIEMNLRRSNHRFDPRKAFFQEQEDVFLKSVAESGEWRDVFACTSGRVFRALAMKKERREAMTEVLRIALERCGDYSKTCFAAIYTERKGIVAYASPKTRSRGVFEGFNANTSLESKRPNAEDVWYLMHHVRTIDRYKSLKKKKNNKNKKMEHETIKTAAAVANPSSSPQKENGRHQRNASFGEEMVLAGGGIVVKPPPPPPPVPSSSSSSMINTQDTALQRFKSSFCEDAYDMSVCLPSGAEGAKFVLVRTMKMRLNEDELIGKEVEYDDAKVKQKLDDEIVYVSIVSKSEDAASRAHESMEELFAQLHSQNLLPDIFLATHERESDIAKTIRPALVQAVASGPSLSDDDEEESESDALLTETAKAAIEKLEHFVYAKPELGQYQIADEDEDADDEKPVRIIREYARMHAAAHYENTNRKFRDEMLEDIVRNKATDEALESGGSTSSLSPQSSSEFRTGFFNFGGLNLNGSDRTAESNNLSPVSHRIFSGNGRSASEASDGSDDINNNTASQKENDNKTSTEQEDNKHKCDTTLKHHRVRYESDSSGVRIACFGADFELFCQFKPNTSCQDAVATTNRLSAYLKANESASFLMNY